MTSDEQQDERYKQAPRTTWILYLRAEALRMRRPEVSVIAHVGILAATFADYDGQNCFPAVDTLAAISGRSEDTVTRCLKTLVAAGLMTRERRQGGKSARMTLLAPLTATTDWEPLLLPFSETRQAAYRRREKSRKAAAEAAGDASRNPSADGFQNPSASGDQEPVPVGGTEEPVTRPRTGGQPVRGRVPEPVRVGGVLHTSGRDTETDSKMAWPVAQPQVPAPEAGDGGTPPGLQSIEGGGHGGRAGQAPLLLSVHGTGQAPLPDHRLIADEMSALYGVRVPVRLAATTALDVLGDLVLPDPTAFVLAALQADPDRHRPAIRPGAQRAAGDS